MYFIVIFHVLIAFMLYVDLHYFHRESKVIKFNEAVRMSVLWIVVALLFNIYILVEYGKSSGVEFFTAYVLEKSLSIDNIFVMVLIFEYFKIPLRFQHRVLYYGIIGAIVMRASFIVIGMSLVHRFEWLMYIFGGILLYSSYEVYKDIKRGQNKSINLRDNFIINYLKRHFNISNDTKCESFFVVKTANGSGYKGGKRVIITPLFISLVMIEFSDIVFAIDSVPAVIAITDDLTIAYTSNIMAILGLRSLYFVLSAAKGKFYYLSHAVALILAMIGVKMILVDLIKVPVVVSLLFIAIVIVSAIILSIKREKLKKE